MVMSVTVMIFSFCMDNDSSLMALYFGGVQRATTGIWQVGIDGIGNEVQMLDLTVYVHHDYDSISLRWRPYAKPIGQRIPLQP